MNKEIKKSIESALKSLKINRRKVVFTAKELDKIAEVAHCQLYCVMYYLRFER